jgi:ABC-2 type transport system ATP-binding protein
MLLSARLYGIPRGEREQRIREALLLVGLSDEADVRVQRYSGGMIRRLEIAQGMIHQPAVLFLDEPTVGLDPTARRAVWNHVQDLRESTNRRCCSQRTWKRPRTLRSDYHSFIEAGFRRWEHPKN